MDFITIVFNNKLEIELLKLQAYSFRYVDIKIINSIIIIFNDEDDFNNNYSRIIFSEVINFYPSNLREKVKILNSKELGLVNYKTDWFTQQAVKIVISKKLNSDYYVILDGKNHFIKNIGFEYFFKDQHVLYDMTFHGQDMVVYYNNCMDFFGIDEKIELNQKAIQTITPFVFETKICLNLINFIEDKYSKSFVNFFMEERKFTEFFFYYAFNKFIGKEAELFLDDSSLRFISIGRADPKIFEYNSIKEKKFYVENRPNLRTFGLHRGSLCFLDNEYKEKLLNFYASYYEPFILDHISSKILFSESKEFHLYLNINVPNDFEWRRYTELNSDLSGFSECEATNHYSTQGYLENRIYK
jgi:hypothetical protein